MDTTLPRPAKKLPPGGDVVVLVLAVDLALAASLLEGLAVCRSFAKYDSTSKSVSETCLILLLSFPKPQQAAVSVGSWSEDTTTC